MRDGPKRLPLGTFQGLAHAHFRLSTLSAEDGRIVRWCKTASSWEVLDPMLWSDEAESCVREQNGGKRTRKRSDPDDENPKLQATPSTSHSIRVSPAPSVVRPFSISRERKGLEPFCVRPFSVSREKKGLAPFCVRPFSVSRERKGLEPFCVRPFSISRETKGLAPFCVRPFSVSRERCWVDTLSLPRDLAYIE
jgi:hypothetical protein